MVLRTAGKGSTAGQPFWGCSRYPRCRYILRTTAGPTPGQDGGY